MYTLTLNRDELNVILTHLQVGKYIDVFQIIQSISRQVNESQAVSEGDDGKDTASAPKPTPAKGG